MNDVEHVKDEVRVISDPYSQENEDYEIYNLFSCDKSLISIFKLHINSEFQGLFNTTNFVFLNNYSYENEYFLFAKILSSLEDYIQEYFEKAFQIHNDPLETIEIKFQDQSDYLSVYEAIKVCQNIFLTYLPIEKKVEFAKNTIFQCNYTDLPNDFFKEQEIGNFNFYALCYFISMDLNILKIEDLDCVKKDKFTKTLNINSFKIHKKDIKKDIDKLFTIPSGIRKNNDIQKRYKRIFDVYLYQNYFSKGSNYHDTIKWLLQKGHTFPNINDPLIQYNTADTSQYNIYITEDTKTIARIKEKLKDLLI